MSPVGALHVSPTRQGWVTKPRSGRHRLAPQTGQGLPNTRQRPAPRRHAPRPPEKGQLASTTRSVIPNLVASFPNGSERSAFDSLTFNSLTPFPPSSFRPHSPLPSPSPSWHSSSLSPTYVLEDLTMNSTYYPTTPRPPRSMRARTSRSPALWTPPTTPSTSKRSKPPNCLFDFPRFICGGTIRAPLFVPS